MKLPAAEAIARLLTDLLGRPTTVKSSLKVGATEPGFVGSLVDASGTLRAITFSDRAFAALTGAALALIPRGVADEAIKKGVVPPNLLENHYEVINVASVLFNALHPHDAHVRLASIDATGPTLPPLARALWLKPSARLDMVVDIANYGTGKLTLVT